MYWESVLTKICELYGVDIQVVLMNEFNLNHFESYSKLKSFDILPLNQDAQEFKIKYLPRLNTLYSLDDWIGCQYYLFQTPSKEHYCLIGPWLPETYLLDTFEHPLCASVNSETIRDGLQEYLFSVPIISDSHKWLSHILIILEEIFLKIEVEFWELDQKVITNTILQRPSYSDHYYELFVESKKSKQYHLENILLDAVSRGDTAHALIALSRLNEFSYDDYKSMPLEQLKRSSSVLQVLCRKAAEKGQVHPHYIDSLSSLINSKLNEIDRFGKLKDFNQQLIVNFCMLVQNYSTEGYSSIIKDTLNYINTNITSDLSLNDITKEIRANPTYLSAKFKEELKLTLTEYINQKRIALAVDMLTYSKLSISEISEKCGFSSQNYFTRVFKAYHKISPSEFRKHV